MNNPSPNQKLLDKFMSHIEYVRDCKHCDTLKTPRQNVRYMKVAPPKKQQQRKSDDAAKESE